MNSCSACLLLLWLNLHEAQAAALKDFYDSGRQRVFPTAETEVFAQQDTDVSSPSFASSQSRSNTISNSTPFASTPTPTPDLESSPQSPNDATTPMESDKTQGQLASAERGLAKRQESTQATASEPAWITSPEWALYSFSSALFPPPTAAATANPEVTAASSFATAVTATTESAATVSSALTTRLKSTLAPSSVESTSSLPTSSIPTTSSLITSTSSLSSTTSTPSTTSASSSSSITSHSSATASPTAIVPAVHVAPSSSSSRTTAIAVGVIVPIIALVFVGAFIFWLRRRRRQAAESDEPRGRFAPFDEDGGRSRFAAGIVAGWKRLRRSGERSPLAKSVPYVPSEKSPALPYDPAPAPPDFARRETTIVTKPGRLPSPSRRPDIQGRHRVNSSAASLTDGSGNDTRGMDFHCEGDSPEQVSAVSSSGEAAAFMSGMPGMLPEGATAGAVAGAASRHRRRSTQTSWLSTSSVDDSARQRNRQSLPRKPVPTPLGRSQSPSAPRTPVHDQPDNTIGSPVSAASNWWTTGRSVPSFDSYRPNVTARDFALGNYEPVRDSRDSRARTSISLSSGPWSDEEEETVEVPLTVGRDVQPHIGTAR